MSGSWGPGWPTDRSADMRPIRATISGAEFPQGVHYELAELAQIIVDACEKDGYLLVPGWCWGYARRPVAGTAVASLHSQGRALDSNAPANPYTERWQQPSGEHAMPDWVGATWEHYGWRWGGPAYGDWMHTEFLGDVDDAQRMLQLARAEHGRGRLPQRPKLEGRPVLEYGDTGPAVVELQRELGLLIDGIYGRRTERAVRDFQAANDLLVDGIVGPVTWAALDDDASDRPKPDNAMPTIQRGNRGSFVAELQRVLNAWYPNLEPLTIDGIFGPRTEARVRYLQQRAGITADGVAGPVTWAVLGF